MIVSKEQLFTILTKKQNVVFVLFVLATLIFWFLNRLSNNYIQQVTYKIAYKDLPERFVFQEEPQHQMEVSVEASGYYLLTQALVNRKLQVSLKNIKRKNKYSYYLLEDELNRQTKETLKDRIHVLGVVEDSLVISLGKKVFKKVPVKSHLNLKFHTGYKSFTQTITPDSIEVSGPEKQIAKIHHVDLNSIAKEDVMETINQTVAIVPSEVPKVNYSQTSAKLSVSVEKITEKTLEVPVTVVNNNESEVVIYPKKIKITCQIRLSDFNELTHKDFTMICDYDKRQEKYMDVELVSKPANVSAVKIEKNKVEYLILK